MCLHTNLIITNKKLCIKMNCSIFKLAHFQIVFHFCKYIELACDKQVTTKSLMQTCSGNVAT